MKRALHFAGLVWLCAAPVICADQNKPKKEPPPPKAAKSSPSPGPEAAKVPKPRDQAPPAPGGGGQPKGAARLPNPANPIAWLRSMTPEQRERVIEKYPPELQEKIRKQLEDFDKLPDQQKQRQLNWNDEFFKLPEDRRESVRKQILAFNALPDDRRRELHPAYVRLSNATPEERANILSRAQFRARFSPEELQMLTVLSEYFPLKK
jgi:hypothetical protein